MVQAKDLTLAEVEDRLRLKPATTLEFFPEWRVDQPVLTELERVMLDRVKDNFISQSRRQMAEGVVKLVVVAPLLDLAGFYQQPYEISVEESVAIVAEDEGDLLQGRIDVLVVRQRVWVLVIESKAARFSVREGIPQALAYMGGSPTPQQPVFGLVTNGEEFVFLKLVKVDNPQYSLSRHFSLLNPGNDLYSVLTVLKHLGLTILAE